MTFNSGETAAALQSYIYIRQDAKTKQEMLIRRAKGEIKWYGLVTVHEGFIIVDDIVVPRQKVSSASTDEDGEALHELMESLGEDAARMRYGGHSHANMAAFHSKTDTDTIEDWGRLLGLDWFISHVENKSGESETRIDIFQPFRVEAIARLTTLTPRSIVEWADEVFDTLIEERTITYGSSSVGPTRGSTQGAMTGGTKPGWRSSSTDSSDSRNGGGHQASKKSGGGTGDRANVRDEDEVGGTKQDVGSDQELESYGASWGWY